jgi:hypothetical protein
MENRRVVWCCWTFGLIYICMFLFFGCVSKAEIMRWRWPGTDGEWANPYNWVSESGEHRTPGPSDDVYLGEWSPLYGSFSRITLGMRNKPVHINSLTVSSGPYCTSPSCFTQRTYYNFNGTSWIPFQFSYANNVGFCVVYLTIIAPTELVVNGPINIGYNSLLQLVGSADDAQALSVIRASSITIDGMIFGSAIFYGSISLTGQAWLFYFSAPYTITPTPPFGGLWQIYGDLTLAFGGLITIYANLNTSDISQVKMSGSFSTGGGYINIYGGQGLNVSDQFTVFSFNSTDITSSGQIVAIPPIPGLPSLSSTASTSSCDNIFTQYTPQYCQQNSAHDLSVLVASGSECCTTPGGVGSSCQPDCPGTPDCNLHGECVAASPAYCSCYDGWTGNACEIPHCPGNPECNDRGTCVVPPSGKPVCECNEGWTAFADCSLPLCPNNCTDETHGTCFTEGDVPQCVCNRGWQLGPNLDCSLPVAACPGIPVQCSGHGDCNIENQTCNCFDGWIGSDCSIPFCQGACSSHGECVWDVWNNNTVCSCSGGWTGPNCDTPICPNNCSGNGYCSAELDPPRCVCKAPASYLNASQVPTPSNEAGFNGFSGESCNISFVPYCEWSDCTENGGSCSNPSFGFDCLVTSCPAGWTDWDCSKTFCENTGIPECSGHGACVVSSGIPSCECRPGYELGPNQDCFYASCELYGCNGRGKCRTDLAVPTCECDPYFYGPNCSIQACLGSPQCSGDDHGQCINWTCVCTPDWQGPDCSIVRCPFNDGRQCNGRGSCNATSTPHTCNCDTGWSGDACQFAMCPNNCSGHGTCDTSNTVLVCDCDDGWEGTDCSVSVSSDGNQNLLIGVLTGVFVGLVVLISIAVLVVGTGYTVWRSRQRKARRTVRLAKLISEVESVGEL